MQRVPPKILYLEFEPQPAARRAYTLKDIQTRIEREEYDHDQEEEKRGMKVHSEQGMMNESTQAKNIRPELEDEGKTNGLHKSFRASAKGTSSPNREGLLGPRRTWT